MDYERGCEVVLVREGRVITRYKVDLPAGILVEQIEIGKWRFRRFGRKGKLNAVQVAEQVYVHDGEIRDVSFQGSHERRLLRTVFAADDTTGLSFRQRQVLEGLIHGQTLSEIAFHLGIRVRGVRHHVDALKLKLQAVSLSQLVARALSENWLGRTPPQGGTGAGRRSDHPKKH